MTIFLDFDGPIVDNFPRHSQLFLDLAEKFNFTPIAPEDYWNYKRQNWPEFEILKKCEKFDPKIFSEYMSLRLSLIETQNYLELNELTAGVQTHLETLKQAGKIVLLTTRNNIENLHWEIKDKKIDHYFDQILCGGSINESSAETKIKLINSSKIKLTQTDFVIGDTEAEVLCGKDLNLITVSLCNGIRTKEYLASLGPTVLSSDLAEFIKTYGPHFQLPKARTQ